MILVASATMRRYRAAGSLSEEVRGALASGEATEIADQWLAAWVRQVLADGPLPPWPDPGGASAALPALAVQRAEFHGIGLLLSDHPAPPPPGCPPVVMEAIRALGRRAALEEQLQRACILPLFAAMGAGGIPVMALKGAALAYLYYDKPAKRPRGDTDVLVPPEHFPAVHAMLERLGWSRDPGQPHGAVLQETWTTDCGAGVRHTLDLHRCPSDRPVLQRILRDDDFWDNAVPLDRLSAHAHAPDRVRMLLHGAVNQAWHEARGFGLGEARILGGRRLIWAVDYHHLAAHFTPAEWEAMIALCHEADAGAIVHRALAGAQGDIGLALPEGVLAQLLPPGGRSATLDFIRANDVLSDAIADLRASNGMAARWRLLVKLALPPRAHLVERYPDAAHWPTLALQARRLIGAAARRIGARRAAGA